MNYENHRMKKGMNRDNRVNGRRLWKRGGIDGEGDRSLRGRGWSLLCKGGCFLWRRLEGWRGRLECESVRGCSLRRDSRSLGSGRWDRGLCFGCRLG